VVVGCSLVSGLLMRSYKTAGPDGIRGQGPILLCGPWRPRHSSGCPHPRSDRFAITSHRPRNLWICF